MVTAKKLIFNRYGDTQMNWIKKKWAQVVAWFQSVVAWFKNVRF